MGDSASSWWHPGRGFSVLICVGAACCLSCSGSSGDSGRAGETGGGAEVAGSRPGGAETFTAEAIDGAAVVHNTGQIWSDTPALAIEPVRMLGCGNDDLAFYEPADIALGPDGDLFVLDAGNHRIVRIDAQGAAVASFGKRGEGPGELQRANGLAIDATGRMYVSDAAARTVKVLAPDGE